MPSPNKTTSYSILISSHNLPAWLDRKLLALCFQVDAVGTTGAGACNVAGPDATSTIPDWETLQTRMQSGWKQHEHALSLTGRQKQDLPWAGPTGQ